MRKITLSMLYVSLLATSIFAVQCTEAQYEQFTGGSRYLFSGASNSDGAKNFVDKKSIVFDKNNQTIEAWCIYQNFTNPQVGLMRKKALFDLKTNKVKMLAFGVSTCSGTILQSRDTENEEEFKSITPNSVDEGILNVLKITLNINSTPDTSESVNENNSVCVQNDPVMVIFKDKRYQKAAPNHSIASKNVAMTYFDTKSIKIDKTNKTIDVLVSFVNTDAERAFYIEMFGDKYKNFGVSTVLRRYFYAKESRTLKAKTELNCDGSIIKSTPNINESEFDMNPDSIDYGVMMDIVKKYNLK
jgi:hypothetical protein